MSDIRATYSGLVSFSVGLVRLITGLVFMVIVTRLLSMEEFGTWTLISGLLFYGVILDPIIAYWATRETAQKIKSGKTSIISGGLFSFGGIIIYLFSVIIVGSQTNIDQGVVVTAVVLIPVMYVHKILSAINSGWKPHVVSYSNFFAEIAKIPLGLIFIFYLDMGVIGVIIAFLIGFIINDVALAWYARDKLRNQIKIEFIKKWLKISWLPLYPRIAPLVARSDVIIFSIITGSVIGLAYYSSALIIAGIVGFTSTFSSAVYGKLLGDENKKFLGQNLVIQIYLMVLLAGLSIIFAKAGLFVLNPIYQVAFIIAIILTFRTLLQTLNVLFAQILTGIEKIDTREESTFKDYIKSKLFVVPSIQLIQTGVYVGVLFFVLIITTETSTHLELVVLWAMIALIIELPFTLVLFILIKKSINLSLEPIRVLKFLLVGVFVFGVTYLTAEQNIVYKGEIIEFIPTILLFIGIGTAGYLAITAIVDLKTRELFKIIFNEISKKRR